NQRAGEIEADLPGAGGGPASDGVVGDVGVDEIEMVVVVESHVALVAELMLFDGGSGKTGKIVEGQAAVGRNPVPRHAAGVSGRVGVRAEHQLPVFLMRGGVNVAELVDINRRLITFAGRRSHLDRGTENSSGQGSCRKKEK